MAQVADAGDGRAFSQHCGPMPALAPSHGGWRCSAALTPDCWSMYFDRRDDADLPMTFHSRGQRPEKAAVQGDSRSWRVISIPSSRG